MKTESNRTSRSIGRAITERDLAVVTGGTDEPPPPPPTDTSTEAPKDQLSGVSRGRRLH